MFLKQKLSAAGLMIGISVVAVLLFKPYLNAQFPYTHDGENHLARFANYKLALKEGQFPPRWAPNLQNRYGYPVFNYNYPLANMLSLPFSALKIQYELTFKILAISFVVFGGMGVYRWLQLSAESKLTQFLVLSTYLSSTAIVNLVYFRGTIGEILAYGLVPWLLWSIRSGLKTDKQSALSFVGRSLLWAGFFLSHNIAVLYTIPVLIVYAVLLSKKTLSKLKQVLLQTSSGLGLSVWFWIPAYFEKHFIVLDGAENASAVTQHLVTLNQLLIGTYTFGFSFPGSIDSLSYAIPPVLLTCLVIGKILYIVSSKKNPKLFTSSHMQTSVGLGVVLFVLQLGVFAFLWQVVPFVSYIQFPWRLSLLASILVLPLVLSVLKVSSKTIKYILIAALVLQLFPLFALRPADFFHKQTIDYDNFSQTTSTQNENLTKGFTYTEIHDWAPTPIIVKGTGRFTIEKWTGSSRTYQVEVSAPSTVVEPTMNFPGWNTTLTEVQTGEKTTPPYVDSGEIQGRLAYDLEPGTYQVTTTFTQNTPARIIGNGVSIVTALSILYFLFLKKFKNRS